MDKVAIVILNWNGSEMLHEYLPSVVNTSGDAAVYVADNASTDNSLEVVRNEFPKVRIITLDQNYGFAEGYNRALSQIEAEYFVLLNSDVETTEGWLEPLVAHMDSHPDTAACQPKILSMTNRKEFEYAGAAGGFIDKFGYPFCRGRLFETIESDCGQYDDETEVLWATGACLFTRARIYNNVGGLDSRFFAHCEEIDYCWRLHHYGYRVMCIPKSKVYHLGGGTLKKTNPRKTFLNFRNNLTMLYKNLPQPELKRIMRYRFLFDYLAALVFFLKGHRDNASAVLRARKDYRKMRYSFASERSRNIITSNDEDIPERVPYSIIFAYYLKGKKRFSQLKYNS